MKQAQSNELDEVVVHLMNAICQQETQIAVAALLGALRMYGDAFPELRTSIGRSLLMTGGSLICADPLYMPQAENHPPIPTTLQ
jgi:hypothetical protein